MLAMWLAQRPTLPCAPDHFRNPSHNSRGLTFWVINSKLWVVVVVIGVGVGFPILGVGSGDHATELRGE
jgi:hypothetical protein